MYVTELEFKYTLCSNISQLIVSNFMLIKRRKKYSCVDEENHYNNTNVLSFNVPLKNQRI